jgi:glycerate-2-kinase
LERALARHDATSALEELGALVRTGPTRTNVSDLVFLIVSAS